MERAAAIITDFGGRTAHAAIVSRELGIPAAVGCGNATEALTDGQKVTLSCAEGDEAIIHEGLLEFTEKEIDVENAPPTRTRIMMNIASPGTAFRWNKLPCLPRDRPGTNRVYYRQRDQGPSHGSRRTGKGQ